MDLYKALHIIPLKHVTYLEMLSTLGYPTLHFTQSSMLVLIEDRGAYMKTG